MLRVEIDGQTIDVTTQAGAWDVVCFCNGVYLRDILERVPVRTDADLSSALRIAHGLDAKPVRVFRGQTQL